MTENMPTPDSKFPEGLIESRVVGTIDSSRFPWLETEANPEAKSTVSVSELTFSGGATVYLASAIPPRLQGFTEKARSNGQKPSADNPYHETDRLMLRACSIEAADESGNNRHIQLMTGGISDQYQDYSIRAYKEGAKANTRRMYYAFTKLEHLPIDNPDPSTETVPTSGNLMIVIGWTDKTTQTKTLKILTGRTHKQLRATGVGSN